VLVDGPQVVAAPLTTPPPADEGSPADLVCDFVAATHKSAAANRTLQHNHDALLLNGLASPQSAGHDARMDFWTLRELPAELWERFLADGDDAAMLAAVNGLAEHKPLHDVDYPAWHRICDVELGGRAFRVTRLVDVDDGQERLFIQPTAYPDYQRPGVPYSRRGKVLIEWVRLEESSPTD
jgi:hypothetical protein